MKITQKAKSYKCKEGFEAQAISAIRQLWRDCIPAQDHMCLTRSLVQ